MSEFQAEVVDIREVGLTGGRRRWQLLLTQTLLRGASGVLIAVSPSGTRLEVPVLGVVAEGPDVWLVVEKPLATGTRVTGQMLESSEQDG